MDKVSSNRIAPAGNDPDGRFAFQVGCMRVLPSDQNTKRALTDRRGYCKANCSGEVVGRSFEVMVSNKSGVEFGVDMRDFERGLSDLELKQLPYATSVALNETAYDALEDVKARMDIAFDRPTRFTKNAFMVWRATKTKLIAVLKERPSLERRNYLKVQETGGVRPQTGMEKLLSKGLAYSGQINAITPTDAARKDKFGNWSRGEQQQALSGIGAQIDKANNTTERSRKRNPRRASFFVRGGDDGGSAGIYRRRGKKVAKIVNFTKRMPDYEPRLDFYENVEEVFVKKFPSKLAGALKRAMETRKG